MRKLAYLVVPLMFGCAAQEPRAEFGNNCIAEGLKEGVTIKFTDDRYGVVKRISGPSERCQDKRFPIRAEVEFQ
jgi:hypothetical protein